MQAEPPIVTHSGPVFRVESVITRGANGRTMRRDVVRHPGAVTIVPLRDDGRIVLIRNARFAVGARLVEFCAGKLERGEEPARAAARELEEECGYAAGALEPLGMFYTSPGFTDERMFVFRATKLREIAQRLEDGEDIEVLDAAPAEVDAMIRDGRIVDGKTIAAWSLHQLRSETAR